MNTKPMVTLRFKDAQHKAAFLGGLSDGFGENYVDLHWPDDESLETAKIVDVTVPDIEEAFCLGFHEQVAQLAGQLEKSKRAEFQARHDLMILRIRRQLEKRDGRKAKKKGRRR